LILVTLLAALLRFWNLTSLGYNSDEAVYAGQAATLSGDPLRSQFFSVFRAHPLLIAFLISIPYRIFGTTQVSVVEFWGRAVVAGSGTLTVSALYILAKVMYSKKAAVIGSLLLALLPYHILVSRQVLLDVGLGFFFVVTLIFLVKFAKTGNLIWAFGIGISTGFAVLSKEVGILLVPIILIFLKLRNFLTLRSFLIMVGGFFLAITPYPLATLQGGGSGRLLYVFQWQVSRPPNHTWLFYLFTLLPYFFLVAALGVLGGLLALRRRTPSDILTLLWLAIPAAFFQFWTVKGFHYMIPVAPAVCLLAARFFDVNWARSFHVQLSRSVSPGTSRLFTTLLVLITASTLFITYTNVISASQTTPLAGLSGLQGTRELGRWIVANVPEGSVFLTIGPTMANIIQFYGNRQAYALSISLNPIRRNPSYPAVYNPDYQIANGYIQYLAWDAYSGTRSPFFSGKLNSYMDRYHGQLLYTVYGTHRAGGGTVPVDLVRIYRVYGKLGT
jgi:4-amino-4-deoxy-L-arabinose transferase-like glycosyltransferase